MAELTLKFKSQEELELFVSKFKYCGGEQATEFCIVVEDLIENELYLSPVSDNN